MRIGLLTSDLTPQHGWGNYGLSVVRALANTKHNLTILAARDSKPIDEHIIHPVLTTTSPPESNSLLKMLVRHRQIATLLNDCDIPMINEFFSTETKLYKIKEMLQFKRSFHLIELIDFIALKPMIKEMVRMNRSKFGKLKMIYTVTCISGSIKINNGQD